MQKLIVTLFRTKKSLITVFAIIMAMASLGVLASCDSSTSSESTSQVEISAAAVPSEAGEITPKLKRVEQGSSIEISATQNYGWVFSHWEGDYQGPTNPFSYVAEQDAKFLAIFEKSDFSLTVEIEGTGDVRQSVKRYKTTSYEYNTEVVLSAEPEKGWRFVRWEGDLTGNENNVTIRVNEPKTVTAVFEKRDYPLRFIVEGSGAIAEEVKTAKTLDYASGSMVELTAQPSDDWQFDRWGRDLSGTENPQTILIDDAKTVTAVFITTPNLRTKTVTDITTNSAISGGEFYDDGGSEIKERGVCWSENPEHTIDVRCTSDGDGLGEYESTITGLIPDTKYYIWAYATNSVGTAYGNQRSFFIYDWQKDTFTEIVDITNPVTGQTWMDRNLGASRVATSMDDEQAYGDLYQWGRAADGHEKRNSGTTTTLSSIDQPGHGNFILASYTPYNWRSQRNDNLWQGVDGTNNPCPNGYRLPTEAEWEAERQSWSSSDKYGAFESLLKLPVAGQRFGSSGVFDTVGSAGYYWSSTVAGFLVNYQALTFSSAPVYSYYRATGKSVRCLKD